MKRVVFNQKGGVGKTSIAVNLAAAFAAQGKKTLIIDLDAQANSSQYLLGDKLSRVTHTIADFFESTLSFRIFKDPLKEAICSTDYDRLYVIPADLSLKELQPKLEARYKVFKLSQAIEAIQEDLNFDEIIIDTPPALNFYSMSGFMAVDSVLIPFDCDAFSADAIEQVAHAVAEVKEDHRPDLEIEGIIVNQFSKSAKLPREIVDEIRALGLPILTPYLTSSVVMKESHHQGVPMVFLKPNHNLSKQYLELAKGLLPAKSQGNRRRKRPSKLTESNQI